MSDDTPTLRLPSAPPPLPPAASTPPTPPPDRPSRGPLIAFVLLSILVVAAIGVLVYILVGRAAANPQNSSTPPATSASAPAAPTSAAPAPPGTFTTFTVPPSQECRGHGKDRTAVDVQVTWATSNATQVWVAQGTADAVAVGTEQIPLSGNQDSFPVPLPIDCNSNSSTFTMTLVGADGAHVSHTWTVLVAGRHG